MSNTNEMLVAAAKKKFRFNSGKGLCTVEDLFDLPLTTLDIIAVALDEEVQKAGRKSFIATKSASTTEASTKLEILKLVIEDKQAAAEAAKVRAEKASQKSFLTSLLEKKKMEPSEGLSLDDIKAQLANL